MWALVSSSSAASPFGTASVRSKHKKHKSLTITQDIVSENSEHDAKYTIDNKEQKRKEGKGNLSILGVFIATLFDTIDQESKYNHHLVAGNDNNSSKNAHH